MNDIINKIRNQLKESIDIKIKEKSQGLFKEKIDSYGVKIPVVNKISKDSFKEIEAFDKAEDFNDEIMRYYINQALEFEV